MAKAPTFAKAFAGRWRIVEMDNWDNDFLDLLESTIGLKYINDPVRADCGKDACPRA